MGPRIVTTFMATVILLTFILGDSLSSNEAMVRTISKGETISFLAIKIYGFYNEEIALLIADANPKIGDLNRVQAGDKIVFPQLVDSKDKPYCLRTSASLAVVTYLSGKSFLLKSKEKEWKSLDANTILTPGDKLKTGKGALVELVVNHTDVMRLSSNTELLIERLADKTGGPESSFRISVGKFWAKIKSYVERSGKFEVGFPTAVAAVRGTVFRMDALPDSITEIFVYKGSVEVGGPQWAPDYGKPRKWSAPKQVEGPKEVPLEEWTEIVRAQQKLIIGPKGVISKNKFNLSADKKDDWVAFNLKRDAILNDSKSGQK